MKKLLRSRGGRSGGGRPKAEPSPASQPDLAAAEARNVGSGGDGSATFGVAKVLSWSSLVLILISGLFLSIIIANSARQTLLTKQQEFALLLAENLNHQIYRRFILPTIVGFGRIALKQKAQYERLEKVILSTIHGLGIQELRIYDLDRIVSFSTQAGVVGQPGLAGMDVSKALEQGDHSFQIEGKPAPFWNVMQWEDKPGTVVLKTVYPLRSEQELGSGGNEGPIIGVLEIYQDITGDYRTVVRFQWLIISTSLLSSLVLFLILLMIFRKVDRINAQRVVERERLERELHQSEKLASMGRMVAGIAHEIRNPLGIIRSSAELLLKRIGNPDDPKDMNGRILKAIFDEARRLSQTVNDFLDYARPKQPKQESLDLSKVLDQALIFLESEFDKRNVAVEKRYLEGLRVLGDKDLVYRALYNVLSNAAQAMDGEGSLVISSETEDKHVTLTFADSGPGFAPDVKDKVLDPFFTTKDQGTGLGMAIANNIVLSHGGELSLDNGPNGGAVVKMRFPRSG